jgi:hypothetical protein
VSESTNSSHQSSDFSLSDLYAVEREAGAAVQANIVVIWVAATTYLTAAVAALALFSGGQLGENLMVLFILPIPACALAGYHLILVGTGAVRSKSIELLEKELENLSAVSPHHHALANRWEGIGSRAETNWNNANKGPAPMPVVSAIALLVPYVSAGLLVYECLRRALEQVGPNSFAFGAFLAGYLIYAEFVLWLGILTVRKILSKP